MANEIARRLRKNMTDAERFVWARIRYRQIGGFRFRRQAPVGPFVADFVCFEAKLVLELDGGQHAEQVEADAARTRWLGANGFRVFRVWNHEVLQNWDGIVEAVVRMLPPTRPAAARRGDLPHRGEVKNRPVRRSPANPPPAVTNNPGR